MARIAPLNIDWKPDRTTGEPVTEQIVGYMCEQVHSGNWPIGSRLPSQRALAEWFGVNRSTVIAAINELSDYGIVEGQHGAGTKRRPRRLPGSRLPKPGTVCLANCFLKFSVRSSFWG